MTEWTWKLGNTSSDAKEKKEIKGKLYRVTSSHYLVDYSPHEARTLAMTIHDVIEENTIVMATGKILYEKALVGGEGEIISATEYQVLIGTKVGWLLARNLKQC